MTDILKIDEKPFLNFLNTLNSGIIKLGTNGSSLHLKDLSSLMKLPWKFLQLVDGETEVKKITNELSQKFNAPEETISDVMEMLQNLSDKGFIEENGRCKKHKFKNGI